MDPIGFAGGINLYTYVGNSPMNMVDPFGLIGFKDVLKNPKVKAIVGAAVGFLIRKLTDNLCPGLARGLVNLAGVAVALEAGVAAICLYMIIGLTWTFAYFCIVSLDPDSMRLSVDAAYTDRPSAAMLINELLYFSYVTQTTLGYGDLSPVAGIARAFAMVQALIGQIYIAVIVARLVGLEIVHSSTDK